MLPRSTGCAEPARGATWARNSRAGHDSSMDRKAVRFDLNLNACDDVAASLLHGRNPVPASLRAASNRLIALWLLECRASHNRVCPCGSWKVHFGDTPNPQEPPRKPTQSVGTQTDFDLRPLMEAGERARKAILKRSPDRGRRIPPFDVDAYGPRIPKQSGRNRKQFLSPYGPLWCPETDLSSSECEDPEDDITDSGGADGEDSDDYVRGSDRDFDIDGYGTEDGADVLRRYFEGHSSTLTLAPTSLGGQTRTIHSGYSSKV
nr:VP2 [Pigeon gyrovirus]